MPLPRIKLRLTPISRAYLRDLAKLGIYGTGEQAVARRLVENGLAEAVEKGLITKKSTDEPGLTAYEEGDEKDED